MNAIDRVKAARAAGRPTGLDFVENIFEDFFELHGDRRFADDKAVVAGIARLAGMPVTVIALEKGHSTKEKLERNFGSAHPEGYRKALRQMKLAEKFARPVVCFVDTAGAFCGVGAEERGQGQAIAENLMELMALKTPVLSVLIGEGGSGGARGVDAGKRGVFGDLARGLRQHTLEGCFQDGSCRRKFKADRGRSVRAWGHRKDHPRTGGRLRAAVRTLEGKYRTGSAHLRGA